MSVQKHSSLGIPPHGRGQHLRLDRGALLGQLLGVHAVVDASDPLLDDGALVEIGRDDVGGGADDFDAAVKGLVVGLCADEAGQEAVVDFSTCQLESTEPRWCFMDSLLIILPDMASHSLGDSTCMYRASTTSSMLCCLISSSTCASCCCFVSFVTGRW